MNKEELVKIFEERKALLDGHFELRSGLHSARYCQVALLQQDPRLLERLCAELIVRLRDEIGDSSEVDTVIAPAMGGITIGHEVARQLGTRYIFAEKEDGKLVLRRKQEISSGETFIVAEDVVTRGGRVQETIDIVKARGGIVKAVGVIFDRSGGTADFDLPFVSLLQMTPKAWPPEECELCRNGIPLEHPGS